MPLDGSRAPASVRPGTGRSELNSAKTNDVLEVEQVVKRFGGVKAVNEVSLTIRQGEIFTLLGPSGCGKTTTLRLIAGLDHPDGGRIFLRGRTIADAARGKFLPPNKRNMGMVFQSYAIWPHKTVYENVAYPLRARRVPRKTMQERVGRVLDLVGLAELANRRGPDLSGGQQQRVALARALVYEPDILLLDEPFSNLDAKLREQIRVQMKALLREIQISVVFVTHDQAEALSLSDRIALMNQGSVVQTGNPLDLYNKPATAFVRDFFGRISLLPGTVGERAGESVAIELTGVQGPTVRVPGLDSARFAKGASVIVSIRPEDIDVRKQGAGVGDIDGTIASALFLGERFECVIRLSDSKTVFAYFPPTQEIREGDRVSIRLVPDRVSVWPT